MVVPGPLAPYVTEFNDELTALGYAPTTRVGHLQVMAHLSKWLRARQLGVADLTAGRVEEYVAGRRSRGYSSFRTLRSLTALLAVLAAQGAPVNPPAAVSGTDVLLGGFERFLREERGLADSTVAAYRWQAERFMADHPDLSALTPGEVSGAVVQKAQTLSVTSARMLAHSLRWLLRYAHLTGLAETDLSTAALPVTGRPGSWLPRGIGRAQADALLAACDRRTATGRRDYAVILILLRLALRASEVAGLRLEDLDWRAGQITVHGKGNRIDALPMPADVGAGVAAYLRCGRPATAERAVFVTAHAPRRALTRGGVSWIVRAACDRAGLPRTGAHRLRHGVACQLLARGAPLAEIGQLLRQNSQTTVSIYARVDVDRLRTICRPWPGRGFGGAR